MATSDIASEVAYTIFKGVSTLAGLTCQVAGVIGAVDAVLNSTEEAGSIDRLEELDTVGAEVIRGAVKTAGIRDITKNTSTSIVIDRRRR